MLVWGLQHTGILWHTDTHRHTWALTPSTWVFWTCLTYIETWCFWSYIQCCALGSKQADLVLSSGCPASYRQSRQLPLASVPCSRKLGGGGAQDDLQGSHVHCHTAHSSSGLETVKCTGNSCYESIHRPKGKRRGRCLHHTVQWTEQVAE